MILIEHILGNVKKDLAWQHKLEGATVDVLVLDQREAQKKPLPTHQSGWP